jgi:hypothetical protein
MFAKLRSRLTYANVMVTILAIIVVGGGGAYAASKVKLKNNSVSTRKIRDGAVTGPKLADGAVTGPKLAAGAVSADKVLPNSLTGAEINQGTLLGTKAANVYGAIFDVSLACCAGQIVRATDPGIKSDGCGPSSCGVIFPRDVGNCVYTATSTNASDNGPTGVPATLEARILPSDHTEVNVDMFDHNGAGILHDFGLTVVCP